MNGQFQISKFIIFFLYNIRFVMFTTFFCEICVLLSFIFTLSVAYYDKIEEFYNY